MLALLDNLKRTIRDFAAREEKLESDFQARSAAAHKHYEEQSEKMESDWEARLAEAQTDLQTKRKKAESKTQTRKEWIEGAYKNARNRASSRIEDRDTEWREQVQSGLAEAEEKRNTDLAAAATANENFQQKLATADAAFKRLEKDARRAFHVSGKFRQLLRRPAAQDEGSAFDGIEFFVRLQKLESQIENGLKEFQKVALPRLFQFVPIWPLAIVLLA